MRNIEIDGKKVYGITKVATIIKYGDWDNNVIRIEKKEKTIRVSLVPEYVLEKGELRLYPDLLFNDFNYNDRDLQDSKYDIGDEPSYKAICRLLAKFVTNWKYVKIEYTPQRIKVFNEIYEKALIDSGLEDSVRLKQLRKYNSRTNYQNVLAR